MDIYTGSVPRKFIRLLLAPAERPLSESVPTTTAQEELGPSDLGLFPLKSNLRLPRHLPKRQLLLVNFLGVNLVLALKSTPQQWLQNS